MGYNDTNSMAIGLKSRKMDFIKYTNDKSYRSEKLTVITDCFNSSLMRETHLIQLNFTE